MPALASKLKPRSEEFKAKAREAEPFFLGVRDFIFGRQPKLENIVSYRSALTLKIEIAYALVV